MREPSRANSRTAGFAALSRRITAATTNLIASGIILVLALGLGRQLVWWWRADTAVLAPDGAADRLPPAEIDPWGPHELEFGDASYSIDYQMVRGDRAEAIAKLLASCRRVADECKPPSGAPSEAEERLLASVGPIEPVDTWHDVRFYGPDSAFPMLVGITGSDAAPDEKSAGESAGKPGAAQLGASRGRVVVWAVAAAAGQQAWSLYTFRLGQPAAVPLARVPSVSWPPGSQRTMTLRDPGGATLLAFAGSGDADQWQRSFADWFRRDGWSPVEKWQLEGGVWHARYARGEHTTADIEFGPQPSGRLSGLMRFVPARETKRDY